MKKSKTMCQGCRNNFYNHTRKEGCWSYDNARIVTRVQVGIWEPPPYHPDRAQEYLNCFSPDGYVMLQADDQRVRDTPFPRVRIAE